jgi:phospholipase/lecithinase/hemolysin
LLSPLDRIHDQYDRAQAKVKRAMQFVNTRSGKRCRPESSFQRAPGYFTKGQRSPIITPHRQITFPRMKTIFAALLLALSTLGHAANYAELVAFGDSLTDMGNRSVAPNKPDMQFRETWVAQLAKPAMLNVLGFKPSGMSFYYGGTNYAVGGSTTEYTAKMGSDRNRGQNLTQQVSKRYLNPAFNTDGVKKDALHVIVIGTNDLMLASISPEQIFSQWADLEKVGAAVAQSTEGQIQALASAGVTHVLWGNVFNIAQSPSVIAKARLLGGAEAPTYFAALTKAAVAHNHEMDAAIVRLEKANPALKIIKLDLFSKFAEVATDPAKYGFTDVTSGANDGKHLFSADGLHPSPLGHHMLAAYAFEVLTALRVGGE